ncbi:hypothetical protein [Streptococcus fryi]
MTFFQKLFRRPKLDAELFSYDDWEGHDFFIRDKRPVVFYIHRQPITFLYMIKSQDYERHFKTYRSARQYFSKLKGD